MEPSNDSLYTLVKPSFANTQIVHLCQRLYGIIPGDTVQLSGYDDQNIWLQNVTSTGSNEYLRQVWPDGYVLKITNSKESEDRELIDAQIQLLQHCADHSISAPVPVQNKDGKYYSIESMEGPKGVCYSHAVRLLTFRSGKLLKQVEVDESLSRELGAFLFQLDNCLKPINHPALKDRDLLFTLFNVPQLKKFIHVIKDKRKEDIVLKCIKEFEDKVFLAMADLEKGVIHGDFNEQNIIINDRKVSAIIDFGDCHYAPYVFDLAIGLSYILLLTKDLTISKQFINGYTRTRKLTNIEKSILIICVRARICQSLVLGLYTYSLNPNNEYLLSTQNDGWDTLELLIQKDDLLFS